MAQEQKPGNIFSPHAGSLVASGIAGIFGLGLVPLTNGLWKWKTGHELPTENVEWVKQFGPFAAAALFFALGWLGSAIVRWHRSKTPKPKGDGRLAIYVAEFGDDKASEQARKRVFRAIEKELGAQHVERLPAGIRLEPEHGVSEEDAYNKAAKKARDLLRSKQGDMLLWGELQSMDGKTTIELHFVGAPKGLDGAEPKSFGMGDTFTLDEHFGPEMGAALAAFAAAKATESIGDGGTYVVDILRPLQRKLGGLAANLPATVTGESRGRFFWAFGSICWRIGEQAGEDAPLHKAVTAYRAALTEYTQSQSPLNWAITQNGLGVALQTLGERESGTELLEEAVSAFRAALTEYTHSRVPLNWAMTQNNLGNALQTLGERESGTARLEEAVAAYRAALTEYTQSRAPLQWAATQNNLGNALQTLGKRESGTDRLEEAVTAYRAALTEYTQSRAPLQWAATQNNLGAVLRILGKWENGTARLEEAVTAYRAALTVYTQSQVPLDWAMTQNNLGNVLQTLGERESGTARLEQAVTAFRAALTEYTQSRAPSQWAIVQNNLGNALEAIGEREGGMVGLEEAAAAFRAALAEFREDNAPYYRQLVQDDLDRVLALIASRTPPNS